MAESPLCNPLFWGGGPSDPTSRSGGLSGEAGGSPGTVSSPRPLEPGEAELPLSSSLVVK